MSKYSYKRNRQKQDPDVKDEVRNGTAVDDWESPLAIFRLSTVPQCREAVATLKRDENDVANSPKRHEDESDDNDNVECCFPLRNAKDALVQKQEAAFYAAESKGVENVSDDRDLYFQASARLNWSRIGTKWRAITVCVSCRFFITSDFGTSKLE